MCRRMLGKVLQSLSITYAEAEDGLQAIQKVQRSLNPPQGLGEEINISEKSSCRNFDLILVSLSVYRHANALLYPALPSPVLPCPVRMSHDGGGVLVMLLL